MVVVTDIDQRGGVATAAEALDGAWGDAVRQTFDYPLRSSDEFLLDRSTSSARPSSKLSSGSPARGFSSVAAEMRKGARRCPSWDGR